MVINVALDQFCGDGAHTGTKLATGPEVLPPVALPELGELLLDETGGASFQVLGDLGRA